MATEKCLVSILFLILACYIPSRKYEADLSRILHGLLTEESFPQTSNKRNVAIGFGSCVDIFMNGVEFLNLVGAIPPAVPVHNEVIKSEEELSESFAFFFNQGSAAE